jgi:hypothetical protein
MNLMNHNYLKAFAMCFYCALVIQILECTNLSTVAGSASQTGNGMLVGKVVSNTGARANDVLVTLRVRGFDPIAFSRSGIGFSRIAVTDVNGQYAFDAVPADTYTIEISSPATEQKTVHFDAIVRKQDTAMLAADTLKAPGMLRAYLPNSLCVHNGYIYIPGTSIGGFVDTATAKSGYIEIDSVPAGQMPGIYYAIYGDATPPRLLRDSIAIFPGEMTLIACLDWKFSKKLILNTCSSGAGVSGNVTNFPVLIRLTGDNFDFTQAKNNGEDIRFTKSDTSFLPFEIERWDPAAGLAEVWVKVDTVHGNDSVQSLSMYWGNVDAQQQSNSAAVFDTAAGFAGVWHLGEINGGVDDATADGFKGIDSGATAAPGIVGNSMNFSDGDYLRIPGLLRSPTTVTLSAWVRSDKTSGQDIVSLGDAALIRFDDVNLTTAGCFHNDSVVNDLTYAIVGSGRFLAKTGWHYLAFSIDAAARVQTLYIDGVQSNVAHYVNPINYAGLGTDTYIGVHGNGKTTFNFVGQIDEVRVSDVALKSDWIKLCYMNQKQLDALVQWR